jgi:hypothetical protein
MRQLLIAVAWTSLPVSAGAELLEVTLAPGATFEKRLTVPPGKFAELCTDLKRGRAVDWRFQAEAPTDFNIHYHYFRQIKYPERHKAIKDANGRLRVGMDQSYCWMWTNRSAENLSLDVTLKETAR